MAKIIDDETMENVLHPGQAFTLRRRKGKSKKLEMTENDLIM